MTKKRRAVAVEEERLLETLKEHPLQKLYNDGLGDEPFRAFAADIKRNGCREKIQILPENKAGYRADTVLDGHKRRDALIYNGETSALVIVRYDLAEADALTVERVFLEFNAHREHRDPLLQARTALRLFEIEKKQPKGRLSDFYHQEARDRVGKSLGMSGRNLQRYWRVLRTPVEVQNAFRAGMIKLVMAEKVADLDERTRQRIAERIRGGEDAKEVVCEYLPTQDSRHRKVGDAVASLVRSLVRGRQDLDGRIDKIRPDRVREYLDELRLAKALISELILKGKQV